MPPIMFFSNFPVSYARWSSTPMFSTHCHCNNGNNSWMNWWMMSEMVKNIGQMFRKPEKQPPVPYAYNPYQQYTQPYQTMYPYVNLNNTQQYPGQEVDEDLMNLQKVYNGKFKIVKINDKYIAIDKDGHRIKAEDAESLMDAIDTYIDGKGKVNKKEKIEGDSDSDSDLDIDTDTDTDIDSDSDSDIDTDNDGKNTPRRGHVPQGWGNAKSILDVDSVHPSYKYGKDKGFISNRASILTNKDKAADKTIELLLLKYNLEIKDATKLDALKQALIDANPSIYDDEGKLLDGVKGETLNTKLDVPTADILKSTFGAADKKVVKKSTTGSIKHNIMVDGITYSEGVEWQSGNKFYKNQEGSWSDFDRDGYFLIQGKKYTLKTLKLSESNVSTGKEIAVGDDVDYGELMGTSSYFNSEEPIFKVENGKVTFRGDYKTRYEMQDENGKKIGVLFAKNGKTLFKPYNSNKEYDMAEIMAGNINIILK